ncbi:MAG: phosphoglycerate kinase [Ignavibacteria bacterium]|nr:phosphoglycerate kinase [Ignavibacteria bacterium]MBK6417778.1 phosphoglycerate kinase [Ignavibacteria bacterium]
MGLFQSHRGSPPPGECVITSIADVDVSGKRVLTRVDFNVPQDENGAITDDNRIRESLPTIRTIIKNGGIAVLMSHLGRPKGERKLKYSLRPVADRLVQLLEADGASVHFAEDCIGEAAATAVAAAKPGDVVLLENLRFYPQEEANDADFCAALAVSGDVYCNDAFGTAHRAHASTSGVAALFPNVCAGLLMQKELAYLGKALDEPARPLVSVMGGSKISGKIDVISALMDKCDTILIGGGMMFTFLKAQGHNVGSSLVEEDRIDLALQLLQDATSRNVQLVLPTDTVAARSFSNDAEQTVVSVTEIEDGWMGLDIGPETSKTYSGIIEAAGTVVWNGPMGVFEFSNFASGTRSVSDAMAKATANGAITIVGGGDSAAAISQFGQATHVTHVSTGGGASLEFLEGKTLPGVVALDR